MNVVMMRYSCLRTLVSSPHRWCLHLSLAVHIHGNALWLGTKFLPPSTPETLRGGGVGTFHVKKKKNVGVPPRVRWPSAVSEASLKGSGDDVVKSGLNPKQICTPRVPPISGPTGDGTSGALRRREKYAIRIFAAILVSRISRIGGPSGFICGFREV